MRVRIEMKSKILGRESFWQRHKYAAGIFIFIFLYNFIFVNDCQLWKVEGYAYTFHLIDFSVGLHTGILPGALFYGLFKNHISQQVMSVYVLVLMAGFMLILSVLLEKAVKTLLKEQKTNALLLVLLFIVGPFTAANCFAWFGFFDMYLFFLSVLFFACLESRVGAFFIPVLYVASVFIHFSSFLTCIPMFTIVLLYKTLQEKDGQKKYRSILAVSLVLAVALGVYFLMFESSNLNYSLEQFQALLAERGGADYNPDDRAYYDYSFYHTVTIVDDIQFSSVGEASSGGMSGLIAFFVNYIKFNYALIARYGLSWRIAQTAKLLISVPFFVWYYWVMIRYIKKVRGNESRRSIVISIYLTFLQLPIAMVAMLFSADIARWTTHTFTFLLAEMLYLISKDKELLNDVEHCIKTNRVWDIAYLAIVATTVIQ